MTVSESGKRETRVGEGYPGVEYVSGGDAGVVCKKRGIVSRTIQNGPGDNQKAWAEAQMDGARGAVSHVGAHPVGLVGGGVGGVGDLLGNGVSGVGGLLGGVGGGDGGVGLGVRPGQAGLDGGVHGVEIVHHDPVLLDPLGQAVVFRVVHTVFSF